jgi:predicted PurR-regulated permease PerM
MTSERAIDRVTPKQWARAIFALGVLLLLAAILAAAWDALGPYLLGLMMAYLLLPVVRRIESWLPHHGRWERLARPIAAIATAVLAIFGFLLLLGILLDPVIDQTSDLLNNLEANWATIKADNDGFRSWYEDNVPEDLQEAIERNVNQIGQALLDGIAGLAGWLLNTTGSFLSAAVALLAVPLFVVYYLMGERDTAENLRRQLPKRWADDAIAVFRIFDRVLGSYTRGVVVESAIVGVITGTGYWLIGVDLALPLGVIAFAGEIVPILGPWIAFGISFPVVLATQPELAIPAVAVFAIIQALEGWFLAPKIQGNSVEFTSAGTLLIIAICGAVAGALGVVFALPAAAVGRTLIVYIARRLDGLAPDEAPAQLRPFVTEAKDPPPKPEVDHPNTSELPLPG